VGTWQFPSGLVSAKMGNVRVNLRLKGGKIGRTKKGGERARKKWEGGGRV